MSPQHTDYYALLGIGRAASAADVDRAYRRAARETHPDIHPDDGSAAERFRAVTDAYETLSDAQRRAAYDDAHPAIHTRTPTPIPVQRRHATVPPVHLGRRRPQPEPLRPTHTSPTGIRIEDMLELAEAISRFAFGRPSP